MQQQSQMFPVMPSFPPANITTEQIQKYLDENKKLILSIMDNQNHGNLAECAQYQALLQKNLMYLAAIADAQPQTPTMQPQMSPNPMMQQGGYYLQHPQAPAAYQQPGLYPQKMPLQFGATHQMPDQQQQQVMNIRPVGPNNDTGVGGGSGRSPAPLGGNDGREDAGHGSSAAGHGNQEAK